MDAFDADVLIYAVMPTHPIGRRIRVLFPPEPDDDSQVRAGIGSVLLLPEVLTKPLREHADQDAAELSTLLGRLDLLPTDRATAELASALGAAYGLRAADAVHLATAVKAGADRFITNNSRDFPTSITEIAVTYPGDLLDPG